MEVTTTKNSGTQKIASTVAVIMPPITPVPMACWLPAPAPVDTASGNTPSMNASEVITMGRRRMRHASTVASTRPLPCSYWLLANSTIRMAFLADRPMVVNRPTWKNTSLDKPRPSVASSAPITPSGTTSITENGIDQLS